MEINYALIGKRIRETRKQRGLSAEELAEIADRSRFAARLRALIHTNRSSFSISIFQPPVPTTSLAAARSVLRDAAARRPSLLASMQYHSR